MIGGAGRAARVLLTVGATAWTGMLLVAVGALVAVHLRGDGIDAVLSGSMSPTIPTGSLVITQPDDRVERGDVVVFHQAASDRLVTHRVVEVRVGSSGREFTTRGDANRTVDVDPVSDTDIRGRVIAHVPRLGGWLHRLHGSTGALVLLGPPTAALVIGSLVDLTRRHREVATDPTTPDKETAS